MKPKLVKRGRVWVCLGFGAVGCGMTASKAYEQWNADRQFRRDLEFRILWNEATLAALSEHQGGGTQ